jgi:outer membrane protein OmpA-like peptidoglycan-associated protein
MKRRSSSPTRRSSAVTVTSSRAVLQRKCACGQHINTGSECEECGRKHSTLQRSAHTPAEPAAIPPVVQDVLQSPGQPLDLSSRAFMEPRFGQDFSNVRVHTDSRAADSAGAVNALAYTVGRDVVFGAGQYAPQSQAGRHLLAHELTHVVQQGSGQVGADAESKAQRSADMVSRGQPANKEMAGTSELSLQKAGKDDPVSAAAGKTADGLSATATATAGAGQNEPPIDEFEFDKTTIPPKHLERLTALRSTLINTPGATVLLTGHTDTVGNEKYNKDLGERRAKAVRDFLTEKNGVSSSRIQVTSMGEMQPAAGQPPAKLDPDKGEKNAQNRRVEIQITGLPSSAPPDKPWSLDPANPTGKKPGPKPIDLNLPPNHTIPPDLPGPRRPPTPDFLKPVPPPIPGTEPKSLSDIFKEKVISPIVDAVTKPLGLSKDLRESIKGWVQDGVIKGSAKAARAAAEAAGVKDSQVLDAIEKATEAALQEKGKSQQ